MIYDESSLHRDGKSFLFNWDVSKVFPTQNVHIKMYTPSEDFLMQL